MTHLWVRAETRANERRVGVTPAGVERLIGAGFRVTVERDDTRAFALAEYKAAGAATAATGAWEHAPSDAIIFGLKELPEGNAPLIHRHIMFGHAFKEQEGWQTFLGRFQEGGGALYDLEYLVDPDGRRVAAFGYWAGYAGAAMSLLALAAQQDGTMSPSVKADPTMDGGKLEGLVRRALADLNPRVIVIGARGRVGGGAIALCEALGCSVTKWDVAETAHGGPFPEILEHDLFLNCILAAPGVPVFVPPAALNTRRTLRVIGDIACDPTSDYSPVPLYVAPTSWEEPCVRVAETPPLDIMAIDNLPSLLPRESSEDFANQLLPHLLTLDQIDTGVWGRAFETFRSQIARL